MRPSCRRIGARCPSIEGSPASSCRRMHRCYIHWCIVHRSPPTALARCKGAAACPGSPPHPARKRLCTDPRRNTRTGRARRPSSFRLCRSCAAYSLNTPRRPARKRRRCPCRCTRLCPRRPQRMKRQRPCSGAWGSVRRRLLTCRRCRRPRASPHRPPLWRTRRCRHSLSSCSRPSPAPNRGRKFPRAPSLRRRRHPHTPRPRTGWLAPRTRSRSCMFVAARQRPR